MTINDGDFIKVDYTESVVDGGVMSTTNKDVAMENDIYEDGAEYEPRLVVVGSGDVTEGFKEDLIGKETGYSGSVEVPPEKAYGAYDPENVELIPINKFKEERPEPGLRVSINGKMGTVIRAIGRKVRIDYNHPLAGKTIKYDYTIMEKVEDRLDKLKNLVTIFARVDLAVEITEDDVAIIDSPWELSYYKEWPMIRRGVAEMAIRLLDLNEVRYVEKHSVESRVTSQVISPPSKEEPEGVEKSEEGAKEAGEAVVETAEAVEAAGEVGAEVEAEGATAEGEEQS